MDVAAYTYSNRRLVRCYHGLYSGRLPMIPCPVTNGDIQVESLSNDSMTNVCASACACVGGIETVWSATATHQWPTAPPAGAQAGISRISPTLGSAARLRNTKEQQGGGEFLKILELQREDPVGDCLDRLNLFFDSFWNTDIRCTALQSASNLCGLLS